MVYSSRAVLVPGLLLIVGGSAGCSDLVEGVVPTSDTEVAPSTSGTTSNSASVTTDTTTPTTESGTGSGSGSSGVPVTSGSESSTSTTADPSTSSSESTAGTTSLPTGETDPSSSSSTSSSTTGTDTTTTGDTTTGTDDTSTTGPVCGDGVAEGTEACDGDDFAGETCITQGFEGGDLSCTNLCVIDNGGCFACGDDNIDPGEECEDGNLDGQDCISLGHTGGTLSCMSCAFDESACTDFALPEPGEVIFSEIMNDPVSVPDGAGGEWVELHNTTGSTLQLNGCRLGVGAPAATYDITTDVLIPAGGYVTFAEQGLAAPGFVPDDTWPNASFPLPDGEGALAFSCAALVDTVAWDSGMEFPNTPGAAMSLDPGSLDATANDTGTNWCDATFSYNGDLGTPGEANPSCTTFSIDFCRLQFPLTIDENEGVETTVFGRLFIAGLTDQSNGNDPHPSVVGYVGYGPDATNPASDLWTWTQGIPNPGWNGPSMGVPDDDEYQAQLSTPSAGDYDYAFRFTGDSGATFTYCDGDPAGSTNGFASVDAGQMTAN